MIALLLALAVTLTPPDPPAEVTPPDYAETWAWCEARFPGRTELQEACQWGAYEMIPATPTQPEWSA